MTFPYMWETGLKVVENELTDSLLQLSDGDTRKAREEIERAIGRVAAMRREIREWREESSSEATSDQRELVLTVHGGDAGDCYDLAGRVRQIGDELGQGYNAGDGWKLDVAEPVGGRSDG